MLDATVQVDLVRRADVEQQSLEFGPQGRGQETVLVCGKNTSVIDCSVIPRGVRLLHVYVTVRTSHRRRKLEKPNPGDPRTLARYK